MNYLKSSLDVDPTTNLKYPELRFGPVDGLILDYVGAAFYLLLDLEIEYNTMLMMIIRKLAGGAITAPKNGT